MKRFLPLILIAVGIIIVVVTVFVIKRSKTGNSNDNPEDMNVPELPQSQWPAVSLTPTDDSKVPNSLGHFLDFRVEKINVPNAKTMDYELVYSTTNGGQQGVPGTVQLTGADIERKLLMGSASSGKYRFDAGVDHGTMTIRFRDGNGKLLGKLSTDFHLQFGDTVLTSQDGKFKYTLDKAVNGVYFVTMQTFAQTNASESVIWQGGYGVFASDGLPHKGSVTQ